MFMQVEWNQNKICKLLRPTQSWHSEQAKRLVTIDATIPWETEQILGGIDDHIRTCLYQIKWTREYESFGITTVWKQCTMSRSRKGRTNRDIMAYPLEDNS